MYCLFVFVAGQHVYFLFSPYYHVTCARTVSATRGACVCLCQLPPSLFSSALFDMADAYGLFAELSAAQATVLRAASVISAVNDARRKDVIQKLPSVTEEDLIRLDNRDSCCPICFTPFLAILASEEIAQAMDSPEGDLGVTRLADTCGHLFCRKDITTWIRQNDSCPTCRRPFIASGGGEEEYLSENEMAAMRNSGISFADLRDTISTSMDRVSQAIRALDNIEQRINAHAARAHTDSEPPRYPREEDEGGRESRDEYAGMYS